ncbi:MAG: SdrD B-like domain-containing protein, partial [Candidatus Hermodarchaeia archaeon]
MNTKNILRNKSTHKYVLLILMTGLFMTACNPADDVTPTPVDPTSTPIVLSGTISGVVWNDECPNYGGNSSLGCIHSNGNMELIGNGILDEGEVGIQTAQVSLGVGLCPSEGLAEATTGDDGRFSFSNLMPGDYCVTVKDQIATPGLWTYPRLDENLGVSWTTITV